MMFQDFHAAGLPATENTEQEPAYQVPVKLSTPPDR